MEQSPDRPFAHLDNEALLAVGAEIADRRRAAYAEQVKIVAIMLWRHEARGQDDRPALVADIMTSIKISRDEAQELLRQAESYLRENPPPSDARID